MKRILISLLFIPTLCLASPQDKQEKAELLLDIMNADATVEAAYKQMKQMIGNMSQQLKIRPEEEAIFANYQKQLFSAMQKEIGWEQLQTPMVDIYVRHYSEQELDDMIAFYQSETGRSMVEKMPRVMQEAMLVSQSMMQNFMPTIQRLSDELRTELQNFRESQ